MGSFDLDRLVQDLMRRVHLLEVGNPLGYSSVSEGSLRILSNEGLTVEGSAKVAGWLVVTGTQRLTGTLDGQGTLDWTGPWYLKGTGQITGDCTVTGKMFVNGPWEMNGNGKITGTVQITGPLTVTGPAVVSGTLNVTGAAAFGNSVDVLNRLSLGPSGYIEAGSVRIDRLGSHGGRIASTGSVLALDAAGSVVVNAPYFTAAAGSFTDLSAIGAISANIKNFLIEHPVKPDHLLRHGATESPVSGVEYWGEERLTPSGECVVRLPDYFEALTKPENRAVLVTARGFVADWGDIDDGAFTVTGPPSGRFSWLVKAERAGADFVLEEPIYGPIRAQS
ncbi:hypothetical protein ACXR2W_00750 [Leucobacter sp. HY1908]